MENRLAGKMGLDRYFLRSGKTTVHLVVHMTPVKKFQIVLLSGTLPWFTIGLASKDKEQCLLLLATPWPSDSRIVPAEILRYLIAHQPNKAIEFDAGMSLVNLADEFERVSARDFSEELNDDSLSRRRRVQIEDAKGTVSYHQSQRQF